MTAEKKAGREKNSWGGETIPLVEDNEQVRNMAGRVLKRRGYHILQAETGKKALALLQKHIIPAHPLLTNVVMPEMNGKDLFMEASKIQPGIRVLFMSGYTDDVIAHRGGVLDAPYQPRIR